MNRCLIRRQELMNKDVELRAEGFCDPGGPGGEAITKTTV